MAADPAGNKPIFYGENNMGSYCNHGDVVMTTKKNSSDDNPGRIWIRQWTEDINIWLLLNKISHITKLILKKFVSLFYINGHY